MHTQIVIVFFPSWWTMIAVDCFMTILACIATAIVVVRWRALKNAGAAAGCICILTGLWIQVCFYLADFWTMVFLPHFISDTEAMAAMHALHLKHSWYVNTLSSGLIVVGLLISITRFVKQMGIVDRNGRALDDSNNLLKSIFENVPVALLIKDAGSIVEKPNKTYLSWYGLDAADLVGWRSQDIEDFQPATDADLMSYQERHVLATGETQTREVERQFADGLLHTVKITKFPVLGKDGAISKVGSVSVDLTPLVEAKRHAEKAMMKAEIANRGKSAFLANMSHELRTPLNAIIGFSETILAQIYGPIGSTKYIGQVKAIHHSGHHLLDLVNDILDMAKIESEEYELVPEDFYLSEVVADSIQLVVSNADQKNVKLVSELPSSIPLVTADKRAIKQILVNLISNAVKFTPQGGRVAVKAVVHNDALTLVVEDTGVGIPAQDIPNIVKPFNQGSRKPRYGAVEGTGLGLSIVASLVRLHQATFDIESEEGKGTRASVVLPGVVQPAAQNVAGHGRQKPAM